MRHAATPLLVLTLSALIFAADLVLPRETVAGIAYVLPVALAFAAGAAGPVATASLCSMLILLAPGLSAAEGEPPWGRTVLANRFLALFAVWVVAVLAVRVHRLLAAGPEFLCPSPPDEQPAAPPREGEALTDSIILAAWLAHTPQVVVARDRRGHSMKTSTAAEADPAVSKALIEDEARVLASGQPLSSPDCRVAADDGSPRRLQTVTLPLRDEAGALIGTLAFAEEPAPADAANDAAALNQLNELNERLERFRRLVECGAIGLVVTGEAGEVQEANDAFLTMLGYSRDDLAAGRLHWSELTDPAQTEPDPPGGSPWEQDCLHRDGERVRVLVGTTPLDPANGDDPRWLRFVIDLRNRRPVPSPEARFAPTSEDVPEPAWPPTAQATVRTAPRSSWHEPWDHRGDRDDLERPARRPPVDAELVGTPVLVVAARPPVRRFVEKELRRARMLPTPVDSAFAALEEIRQAERQGRPFPLVVIDADLPEVSGLALAERLRREPEPAAALLVITGRSGPHGAAERCDRLGVTHCELDPLSGDELLDAVNEALGIGPRAAKRHRGPSGSSHAAIFPPSQRVDWPAALRNAAGDRILLGTLVQDFLTEAPNWLRDARVAIAAGDAAALRAPVRSIVRRAQALGCDDLTTIAGQLESLAARDRLDAAPALWDAVRSEYAAVAVDLSDFQMTADADLRPA